jgi:hypothetical protein
VAPGEADGEWLAKGQDGERGRGLGVLALRQPPHHVGLVGTVATMVVVVVMMVVPLLLTMMVVAAM